MLSANESASLRDRLVQEISAITTDEALALWAYRSLPLKNTLTQVDAQAVEAAYLAKLSSDPASQLEFMEDRIASHGDHEPLPLFAPRTKAVRRRSKASPHNHASSVGRAHAMRTTSRLPDPDRWVGK